MTGKVFAKSTASFFARYLNFSSTALQIGALVLLLVATGSFSVSQHWHRKLRFDQGLHPVTCNAAAEDAAGLNGDLSTDVHAGRDYMGTIAGMLREERFEELDCLADRVRSSKERFSGGAWKLHTLYAGLSSPIQYPMTHATEEDWKIHLQRLQRWVTARPKSVTARVALALAFIYYAEDARGDGYANTVSESGWKLFRERTAEAKRILEEASALSTKCPEWYSHAGGSSEPELERG